MFVQVVRGKVWKVWKSPFLVSYFSWARVVHEPGNVYIYLREEKPHNPTARGIG